MFSKAVLTVKGLVMPTLFRRKSNQSLGQTTETIMTDRALKVYVPVDSFESTPNIW